MTLRSAIRIVRLNPRLSAPASRVIRDLVRNLTYYNDWARREEIQKYTARNLLKMWREDKHSVLLAFSGNRIIGFCLSKYDDGVIWLSWFGVVGSFRGRGVGSMLLGELEHTALARSCHKIWCDTRTANKVSQSVLRKAGYRRICELKRHWYKQDFYIWQKFLI
jgi:ribosomal protein S18 acetylase RimI-like enzyme